MKTPDWLVFFRRKLPSANCVLVRGSRPVLVDSGLKLLILPLLTALACRLLSIGDLAMAVAVIFAALPTATSSYILAQQMGGDARLMAALLTVQTLAAVVTMLLLLLLLV